jgi:hypothetical protein
LLFRWFVGIGAHDGLGPFGVLEEPRPAKGDIAVKFLAAALAQPKVKSFCRAITSRSMAC